MVRPGRQFLHLLNGLGAQEALGRSDGTMPFEPLPQLNPSAYDTVPAENARYFHGSDAEFGAGDVVERGSHPTGPFASFDPEWAGAHGQHIYEVEPVGDAHHTWGNNVVAGHGWRVLGHVGIGDRRLLRDR